METTMAIAEMLKNKNKQNHQLKSIKRPTFIQAHWVYQIFRFVLPIISTIVEYVTVNLDCQFDGI